MRLYARDLGLHYPVDSVLIAGGARPLLYGTYRTLLDPGDVAIYPVPSWNNNHYAYLSGARGDRDPRSTADVELLPDRRTRSVLTSPGARLLIINSPLNPTGTVISRAAADASRSWWWRRTTARPERRRRAALLRLRSGLLDAHLRRAPSTTRRSSSFPRVAPYTLLPRRALEGVLRDRHARRLGRHAARDPQPHGRHPRARRRVGAEGRAGRRGAKLARRDRRRCTPSRHR